MRPRYEVIRPKEKIPVCIAFEFLSKLVAPVRRQHCAAQAFQTLGEERQDAMFRGSGQKLTPVPIRRGACVNPCRQVGRVEQPVEEQVFALRRNLRGFQHVRATIDKPGPGPALCRPWICTNEALGDFLTLRFSDAIPVRAKDFSQS